MSRLHQLFALTLALLVVAPGCDIDESAGTGEALAQEHVGEVDTGEDNAGGADDDAAAALLLACGIEPACDALTLAGDEAAPSADFGADGLCVLEALTNGDRTLIQTVTVFDGSIANLDFAVVGDGVVVRQAYGTSDGVGEWINPPMRCTLQGPEFFAGCRAGLTPECLDPEAWVVSCEAASELVCADIS
ncbi:MAG: hypothetical protein KC420_17180 [Myxococcales bacterium]|nr:hypothetical protein [Myxococcales bacterium]MCB9566437.1 hypothetical protein [Myxococcales bacterium]MCB9705708.1 hypothetical protein [Myxococcales bacterium]